MTLITFNGPAGYDLDWDLAPIAAGTITTSTSDTVVIAYNGDETLTLTGTFLVDTPTTRPTGGTIDVISWSDTGESTVIETSISVGEFFAFVDTNDGAGLVAQLLAGDDTINGSVGNDTLNGLGGNDQISTGGGADTINAGEGDDTIILNALRTGGSINGGADSGTGNRDTVAVSMAAASAPTFPGDLYSTVQLTGALSNVETMQFNSLVGERLRVAVGSWHANQITTLSGGAGSDQLQILALSSVSTNFTLSPLTLTNWNSNDNVTLVGISLDATPSNFALNSAAYSGQAGLIGGAGNDTLTSGAGNDFVLTGGGADTVSTGAGDDFIILNAPVTAGSTFNGGADSGTGNRDTVAVSMAAASAPTFPGDLYSTVQLTGALSNVETVQFNSLVGERLRVAVGSWHANQITTLSGGAGSDQLQILALSSVSTNFTLSPLTLTNWNSNDNVMLVGVSLGGTPSNFTLNSTVHSGQAGLIGGAGNDTLTSGAGNDFVLTGGGLDTVSTGAGDDFIILNAPVTAVSTFDGGGDIDTISYASGGASGVNVNLGNGTASGGHGDHTLSGIENVTGSSLDDTLIGSGDANVLIGGDGIDIIFGGAGSDTLNGGNGNDSLYGQEGDDTLIGGDGVDTQFLINVTGPVVANLGTGIVTSSEGTDSLDGVESLIIFAPNGTGFGDSLTGDGNDNLLAGGSGNDTIDGGDGNDTLFGNRDNDTLIGGIGNDTASYAAGGTGGGVNVNLATGLASGGQGNDTLSGIENVTGSSLDDTLIGSGIANVLIGGDGADVLLGLGGNDALDGGNGGGSGDNAIYLTGTTGTLQLVSGTGGKVLVNRLEGGVFAETVFEITPTGQGSATVAGLGSAGWQGTDTVTNTENLVFTMDGGSFPAGTLVVAQLTTSTVPVAGGFILTLGSVGDDTINLADFPTSDRVFGNFGNDIVTGTANNDLLFDGDGNDTLIGFDGADVLNGGTGQNILDGGADDDTIVIDTAFLPGSQFQGGTEFDTLELHSDPNAPLAFSFFEPDGIEHTVYNFFGSPVTSLERIDFASDADTALTMLMQFGPQSADIAVLDGGLGGDQLFLIGFAPNAGTPYAFEAPVLDYIDWTGTDRAYRQADRVTLIANGNGDVTLTASAHDGVMHLGGANGNDTLIGSDDLETMNGGAGVNILHGGGGSDGLILSNNYTNGNPLTETTFNGAGSLFDGGAGLDPDFLMLGGNVDFQGNIEDIEGIFLMPSTTNATGPSQLPTSVTISGAIWADLPSNLILDGVGTITVVLEPGQSFDTTAYLFEPGSDVELLFDSEGNVGDGYIAGATVFIDANRNSILDFGEPSTLTDANGDFSFLSSVTGPVRAFGGINVDTGLANDLLLSAPEGSSIVNPLTTLVQAIVETTGATADDAQGQVKDALGLEGTIDLMTLDLIAESTIDPAALEAQKAAASVAKILETVVDAGGDAGLALDTLTEAILTPPSPGSSFDISDRALLTDIYTDADVPTAEIADLVTQTQETVQNIEDAETLDDVTDVQAGDLVNLTGANGKDALNGTGANERISGLNGVDTLHGGKGSDLLLGGNGSDIMTGGEGNDILVGGKGGDTMDGGDGADIFIFAKSDSSSSDTVKGFSVEADRLYFAPGVAATGKTEAGGSTSLSLSDGGSIILEGVIGVADYNDLITNSLPLWAQSWSIA